MIHEELVKRIADKTDSSILESEQFLRGFVHTILTKIASNETISIQGFGNFEPKIKAERKIYNPTNKTYTVTPEKKTWGFKMSGALKEKINK